VRYVGPIDGHDLDQLLYYLGHVQQLDGPTMLHIVTQKGKGYKIAESDPINWHGASKFDPDNPIVAGKGYTWASAFGDTVTELTRHDDRVWVITPAMREGSGLVEYSKVHPERYLDVGIAEDVAVTTAAGLALRGEKPIVAIYSTFLQRGFDQVVHDVCIENLDVIFAVDRAGLVGGDGATHQGVYDLSYLRALPNMSVAMPKDAAEMRAMFKTALRLGGSKALRWPRGKNARDPARTRRELARTRVGSWEIIKPGRRAYLLGLGPTLIYALEAAQGLDAVGVVNARFVKPLDEAMLNAWLERRGPDHGRRSVLSGRLGSAVAEVLKDNGLEVPLVAWGFRRARAARRSGPSA
jgi:1-deoxy-D-xylulose-5-phosphate synthase